MTSEKKTEFHKVAEQKGWLLKDIAERWGITPRQLSRVAHEPKQRDLDAINGIPKKK